MFCLSATSTISRRCYRELFSLVTTFGVSIFPRSDPGTEFTAEVRNLFVQVAQYHTRPWRSGSPSRSMIGRNSRERLNETFIEICETWPWRWNEYMQAHRTTPDPRLPEKAIPFRLQFSRHAITPTPDGGGSRGLHNFVADNLSNLRQVQEVRDDR